jgi:hypothetical protein
MDNKTRKEIKDKILEILNDNPVISIICKKAGISRATFYRWINDDYDFKKKCANTKMIGIKGINDLCESVIINKIREGNFQVAKFWLEVHSEAYAFARKSEKSHTWHRNKIKNNLDVSFEINHDEDDDLL